MKFRKMSSLLTTLCVLSLSAALPLVAAQPDMLFKGQAPEQYSPGNKVAIPAEALENAAGKGVQKAYVDELVHLGNVYLGAQHFAFGCSPTGQYVQLFDESKWLISPFLNQRDTVRTWKNTDVIVIKPRPSAWYDYIYVYYPKFVLQNMTTNQSVDADMDTPPAYVGAFTYYINYIDFSNRLVYLNDNSVWYISPYDYSYVKWQVGDRMIIGVNQNWVFAPYPYILINATMKEVPFSEAALTL